MFSLISGLYSLLTEQPQANLLIVGLESAGKSTLVECVKALHSHHTPIDATKMRPTIGLNVANIEASEMKLTLWDLGGHIDLRSIWKDYYASCHCILFVVNMSHIDHQIEAIKSELCAMNEHPDLKDVPFVILLNYADTPPDMDHYKSLLNLSTLENRPLKLSMANVLKGKGVQDAFRIVTEMIKKHGRHVETKDFI